MSKAFTGMLLLCSAIVLGPNTAAADEAEVCENGSQHSPERAMMACSTVIEERLANGGSVGWAYNNRCYARNRAGNFHAALDDCNRAVELKPSQHAFNNRAWANEKLGNLQEAISDSTRAIALDATYWQAYNTRANVRCMLGQVATSVEDRLAAIEGGRWKPRDAQAWLKNRGYYDGPVDGAFGTSSQNALRAWTRDGCPGI